jgi:hypothetical protein
MNEAPVRRKNWGRLKLVVFALMPASVLLVGAEVFATLTIEREIRVIPNDTDKGSTYTMRIGRLSWSRRSVTPLNSMGFPDREFANLDSKGSCVHVVFSGDSYVFGDGVDRDSSFVSLIRRWSEERSPERCIRFFNIAERGTSIDRQTERIRETLGLLQPDVVLLGQYENDLTDLTFSRARADSARARESETGNWRSVRERFRVLDLNLVRFLSYHVFAFMIRRDIHYDILVHWSVVADSSRHELAASLMREYEERYDTLTEELKAHGVAFGVMVLPGKFNLMAGRYPEEPFFLGLAEHHRVPALRLYPPLTEQRSPYPFLMYDGHLNELGNVLVARELYTWLFEVQPAPFSVLRAN